MTNLINSPIWHQLKAHHQQLMHVHLSELFQGDAKRFENYSTQFEGLFFDHSKNHLCDETMTLLFQLAENAQLRDKIDNLFNGAIVNSTEQRPALHTALRHHKQEALMVQQQNIMPMIKQSLAKMEGFTRAVHQGEYLGFSKRPITDVVNLGIGGSHLGPELVCQALKAYALENIRCHFVANIDAGNLIETIRHLNPETTLFIVASKTFTTKETLTNAETAKKWLLNAAGDPKAIKQHFVAITANADKAIQFGVDRDNIFEFWDFVGGRYSLWSAIGLSIALQVGFHKFTELLDGAAAMDRHFRSTDFHENIPVLMALIGVWYINFFNCKNQMYYSL